MKIIMELGIIGYKDATEFTGEQFSVIDAILSYLSDNNISWDYDSYVEDEENVVCSGFIVGDKVENLINIYCKTMNISDSQIFEHCLNCDNIQDVIPIMQSCILRSKYFIRFLQ